MKLINMKYLLKSSIIIPTKNRPHELLKAVNSILNQSLLPFELIIVDQSDSLLSSKLIKELHFGDILVKYIYDKTITGLVHAKEVGCKNASGDIIFFLEDDIILSNDYIKEIMQGFIHIIDMVGCSGIVSNTPHQNFVYNLFWSLFHRGIFADQRVQIYRSYMNVKSINPILIKSNMISGGLSAWRKEIFNFIPFDKDNGFHMLEDIDFSTRVAEKFGSFLYINTSAKLEHLPSSINRGNLESRLSQKVYETVIFYRKRSPSFILKFCLVWLLFGIFLESFLLSIKTLSFNCLISYFKGLIRGYNQLLFQ